jgi:hypothetical protein
MTFLRPLVSYFSVATSLLLCSGGNSLIRELSNRRGNKSKKCYGNSLKFNCKEEWENRVILGQDCRTRKPLIFLRWDIGILMGMIVVGRKDVTVLEKGQLLK